MSRSWVLGSATLKNPFDYIPEYIEKSVVHDTLANVTKKQIRGRKTSHKLVIKNLTVSEFEVINNVVKLNTPQTFTVTDGSLTVSARSVHIVIADRKFNYK